MAEKEKDLTPNLYARLAPDKGPKGRLVISVHNMTDGQPPPKPEDAEGEVVQISRHWGVVAGGWLDGDKFTPNSGSNPAEQNRFVKGGPADRGQSRSRVYEEEATPAPKDETPKVVTARQAARQQTAEPRSVEPVTPAADEKREAAKARETRRKKSA